MIGWPQGAGEERVYKSDKEGGVDTMSYADVYYEIKDEDSERGGLM